MACTSMRRLAILLLALSACALPSCTTGVLIANADTGYESAGDRYIRLRLATVRLDVVDVNPEQATLRGALCAQGNADGAPLRALQFRLPFQAWNGSGEPWPIRLGMFQLTRANSGVPGSEPALLQAPDGDTVVALVPPGSGATFDVLVHAAGLPACEDPLQGEYRLTVVDESGAPLLVKTLSAGSYSQLAQVARFAAVMTLLLVGIAAI
jgi:hypothetical protein